MLRVQSPQPLPLMPLMQFFEGRSMNVLEARIIKPSLEEVFVRLTGVEAGEMKKDKEGQKK